MNSLPTAAEALLAKLLSTLSTPNTNHSATVATAQLDAAETLMTHSDNELVQTAVRAALMAGINGENGYQINHLVRAIDLLLNWGLA